MCALQSCNISDYTILGLPHKVPKTRRSLVIRSRRVNLNHMIADDGALYVTMNLIPRCSF